VPEAYGHPFSFGKRPDPFFDPDCRDTLAVTAAFNRVAKILSEVRGRPEVLGEGNERPVLVAMKSDHLVTGQREAYRTVRVRRIVERGKVHELFLRETEAAYLRPVCANG
jgi:hypothetical protein